MCPTYPLYPCNSIYMSYIFSMYLYALVLSLLSLSPRPPRALPALSPFWTDFRNALAALYRAA